MGVFKCLSNTSSHVDMRQTSQITDENSFAIVKMGGLESFAGTLKKTEILTKNLKFMKLFR